MLAKLQHWARANPLMVVALAAVAGILVAESEQPLHRFWVAVSAAALLIATLWRGWVWSLLGGAMLLFAFIHETRIAETYRHPLHLLLQEFDEPLSAVVRGRLLPEFDSTDDGRAHALCTTLHVEMPSLGTSCEQPAVLLVRLPRGAIFPSAGEYEMRGEISLPRPAAAPGTFDARDYALRSGRVARFEARHLRRIGDSGQELQSRFLEAAERCRRWISTSLTLDLEDDAETTAVIRAMALGVSSEAAEEIEDAFRNSGTLHVFAVSGLHVGLLGVIALALLRQIGLRRSASLWVMLALVFAYAFITGWRPSAARAAFMVAIFSCGALADQESSLQNSLGVAALLLLAVDTHQLFMPGFQLSFVVLWLSVIGSVPLLQRLVPFTEIDPFLPPQLANWHQRLGWQARLWLVRTVSVSTAAWIGSLPFILGHFHSVTPVAVVANCVLVPLSFLCLGTTSLSLCAAALHLSGVQIILNNANWALAKAMIASAAWFAGLPGSHFHLRMSADNATPAVWRMLALPHSGAANHLRVGRSQWLLDTGDEAHFRRVLRPYLHGQGINTIRGVFLSHNDAAHVGAVESVSRTFGTPRLYCSVQEPGRHDSSLSSLRQLAEAATLRKLSVDETIDLSDDAAFRVTAQVLHPSFAVADARGDDRAMVLLLRVGPWRVLWMSDAGWNTEQLLADGIADLRCDVLIRSQHEQDHEMSRRFLLKAAPQIILCGSDARSSDARLPASLIQHAKELHIPLFDTWRDGCIELHFAPNTLKATAQYRERGAVLKKPNG